MTRPSKRNPLETKRKKRRVQKQKHSTHYKIATPPTKAAPNIPQAAVCKATAPPVEVAEGDLVLDDDGDDGSEP